MVVVLLEMVKLEDEAVIVLVAALVVLSEEEWELDVETVVIDIVVVAESGVVVEARSDDNEDGSIAAKIVLRGSPSELM